MAKRKRLAVVAAVVVVLVIIIAVVATCGPSGAPDVLKMKLADAEADASSAGLVLEVSEYIPSFDEQPDVVLAQFPDVGVKSPDGILHVSVSREPIPVQINSIRDYDPDGDNKSENPRQVPNLTDGNLDTAWTTESYKTPDYEGMVKTGVGLAFALADEARMIKLDYTLTGWTGEIQKVTPDGIAAAVAEIGTGQKVVTWQEGITAGRIWFTQLAFVADTGKYGVAISELSFYK